MHRFDPLKCAAQITIPSVAPPLVAFLCGRLTAGWMGYIDEGNLLYVFIFVQCLLQVNISLRSSWILIIGEDMRMIHHQQIAFSCHPFPTHQLDICISSTGYLAVLASTLTTLVTSLLALSDCLVAQFASLFFSFNCLWFCFFHCNLRNGYCCCCCGLIQV